MEDSQVSSPPSSSAAAAVVSEDAMQDSQVDESLSTTTLTTTTRTTTTSSSSSNNNHNNTPPLPISPSLVGWTEPSTLQEKRSLYACGNDFVTLDQLELYPSYAEKNRLEQPSIEGIKKVFSSYLRNREYPILSQFNPEHDAIKKGYYDYNEAINKKISFFRGDVSQLEIDAVVNAANESLLGGGGIDGGKYKCYNNGNSTIVLYIFVYICTYLYIYISIIDITDSHNTMSSSDVILSLLLHLYHHLLDDHIAIHRAAGGILRKYNALLNGCDTGCTKISPGFKLPAKYILHTGEYNDTS